MYIWIILMLLGVFLDQISKYLIVMYMELEQSVDIIPRVFRFTYIRNEGAAFGSMADSRWIFMVVSCIMIVGIFVYIFWKKPQSKLLMSALTLIVAGGIGNMIDRIRLGYVIDFLDFCAFPNLWMWTFNVADAFVCIGAGLMILWMILDMVREQKAEKLRKAEAIAATTENRSEEELTELSVNEETGDNDEQQ
ncbi:MAG: signal peptidase II [Ruminococcaceae bacterium]|nr:signal peptidase II [Oscillospiraceae bacterium]